VLLGGAAAGCAVSDVQTVEGLVIAVEGGSPESIESFTLRATDGATLRFFIEAPLDLGNGGFPTPHLREHQALAEPVRVTYRVSRVDGTDRFVVVRLEDAA
jgi:hypothetical protein